MVALASVMAKKQGRLPVSRDELERLPGISQYMASGVLLLCHGQREALVDVNVARVLERSSASATWQISAMIRTSKNLRKWLYPPPTPSLATGQSST